MTNTMTQKIALDNALEYLMGNDMPIGWDIDGTIEKLQAMRNQLEKKSYSKSTKNVAKDKAIKELILSVLATCDEPVTMGEMVALTDGSYKTQEMTPRATSLVEMGKVVKITNKGRNYYSLA